jgi:hypothetical protein
VTAEEIDADLLAVEAGRLDVTTPPMISAWGRRPKVAISSAELLTARCRRTYAAIGAHGVPTRRCPRTRAAARAASHP